METVNKQTSNLSPEGAAANSPRREPWDQNAPTGFPSRGAATENRPGMKWGNVCRPSGAGKSSCGPMDPRLAPWAVFCRRSAAFVGLVVILLVFLPSCAKVKAKSEALEAVTVGVTNATRKSLQRQITLSSELVPFQEIDVYAKESGFVKNLNVDYGRRLQAGQLMATLEIPALDRSHRRIRRQSRAPGTKWCEPYTKGVLT